MFFPRSLKITLASFVFGFSAFVSSSTYSASFGITANVSGLGTESAFAPAISLDPNSGSANVDIDWSDSGAFQSIKFNSQTAAVPNLTFNTTLPSLPGIGSLGSLSGTFSAVTIHNFTSNPSPATEISSIGTSGGTWGAASGAYSVTDAPFSLNGTGLLSFLTTSLNLGTTSYTNPSSFTAGSVVVGPSVGGFSPITVTIPYSYEQFLLGPYTVIPGLLTQVGALVEVSGQLVYAGQVATASVVPEASTLILVGSALAMIALVMLRRRKQAA
jgi:hypothetical protein